MTTHSYLSFPHEYSAELLPGLPSGANQHDIFYYPGATESGRLEGVVVKVSPKSQAPWIGVFAFGYPENEYSESNGIYSCPNPHALCVVSDGDAFVVDTNAPKNWTIVRCTPVLTVKSLVEHQLLLFIDFSSIWAWGTDGLKWYANVAHDGLEVEGVNESSVYGRAFGPVPGKESVYFEVELKSGKVTGGNCI